VRLVKKGVPVNNLTNIRQTAFLLKGNHSDYSTDKEWGEIELASHEECLNDKKKFALNFRHIEEESNKAEAKKLVQRIGNDSVVVNPPWPVLQEKEIDRIYDLPFTRLPHPRYRDKEPIPAYEMIRHSVNIHRGCFGGCAFCTISAHQGKFIASRSVESVLREIDAIVQMPDFKGYISDLGGPSANMYKMKGVDEQICLKCKRASCIFPSVCKNLNISHRSLLELYRKVRAHKDIKKAFVSSGIRYDLILEKNDDPEINNINMQYLSELVSYHVSGRLKVAPEHTSDNVLAVMRKPSFSLFKKLAFEFDRINENAELKQQLIPYFISSHPGSRPEDMAHLAIETKRMKFLLEQVQDFTPTPMTMAAVMYYSGYHPYTLEKVFTARTQREKLDQRMFFFWYKKEYRQSIIKYLKSKGRQDLINQLFK
ncbi:MAG: YgiQ family radical SAM protein, partial [Prolixibacteraceae bacterium]|nr:YgiQ family radical SAM protein [Prolixibacteraceae bacterium]